MGAPADDPGHGEKRSVDVLGDSDQVIDETRVEIHVGAQGLDMSLHLVDSLLGDLLNPLQKFVLIQASLLGSQLGRHLLQQDGPRVGKGVDRMSYTIDKPLSIKFFPAEDPFQPLCDEILIFPVLDGGFEVIQHLGDLDVGTSVLRALEGSDPGRDRRIGI